VCCHGQLPSFPTRRSSDLEALFDGLGGVAPGNTVRYVIRVDNFGPSDVEQARVLDAFPPEFSSVSWRCFSSDGAQCVAGLQQGKDRKSTRLNSSHVKISYA